MVFFVYRYSTFIYSICHTKHFLSVFGVFLKLRHRIAAQRASIFLFIPVFFYFLKCRGLFIEIGLAQQPSQYVIALSGSKFCFRITNKRPNKLQKPMYCFTNFLDFALAKGFTCPRGAFTNKIEVRISRRMTKI
ncbi:hypothetical protein C9E91_12235 [Rhizobium sp. SEMIA4064]|nr:hypothetical protein C9E91_12235 [Rhizobium sp. SEMIA4064]